MWCIINLPNGTQQAVKWDPKAIGQECLEKVCKALGIICEMEYFGLEHWTPNQVESRTRQWINLRNRLSCDNSSGIQLMLALRVKFWVPIHFILQESVRDLFYMQAKVDLLEARLNARDWANAAKLAALLCQADGIRFNELSLKSKCPISTKKEQDLMKQQQQLQQKEKKDKEYALSFKKRRLSKQKSMESIDNSQNANAPANLVLHLSAASSSTAGGHQTNSTNITPTSSTDAIPSSSMSCSFYNSSNTKNDAQKTNVLENDLSTSPLRIYQDYIISPANDLHTNIPDNFLHQIAVEHGKLSMLKMTPKSAKYWLLQEIQELPGYGEELFSGVSTNESSVRCDISVGAHGITVYIGDATNTIPFSAIASAKSFRRTFKLEYVDDHNDRKDLEIKLPKHAIAAGLYRSITERHAFYVCDKVRGVVTNQFTRDLKGTIASMFKEDTELGKRYVFDIQHTCREVHDQARRILHERGIEINAPNSDGLEEIVRFLPKSATSTARVGGLRNDDNQGSSLTLNSGLTRVASFTISDKLDLVIREKEECEAAIERCVDSRISEAMTCKICMDRTINSMFNPCCHVTACMQCAARCINCPHCRVKISSVVKIYLPPELRTQQNSNSSSTGTIQSVTSKNDEVGNGSSNKKTYTASTHPITASI